MKTKIDVSVCEGRHDMPLGADGTIFPKTIPEDLLTRPRELEKYAKIRLAELLDTELVAFPVDCRLRKIEVNLFVTGLTVATLAVVNVCLKNDIELTCWHYNKETGRYFPQYMW